MSSLSEALKTDTRFHPGIIGVILVLSLLGIAGLVSYMEGYRYLDAFYACFITFSLVGFGDINIYVSILLKLLCFWKFLMLAPRSSKSSVILLMNMEYIPYKRWLNK